MKGFKQYLKENAIIPNVNNILTDIQSMKTKLIDKNLGTLELMDKLNIVLNNYFIKFKQSEDDYYSSDNLKEVGITSAHISTDGIIYIDVVFEDFWKTFDSNEVLYDIDTSWNTFISVLDKFISHEMIHRVQLKKMKVKQTSRNGGSQDRDQTSYFSNPQEMMAWAHDCIKEYILAGYSRETITKILLDPYNSSYRTESDSMYRYTEYFESRSKEIKQFLKYCYEYLQSITKESK